MYCRAGSAQVFMAPNGSAAEAKPLQYLVLTRASADLRLCCAALEQTTSKRKSVEVSWIDERVAYPGNQSDMIIKKDNTSHPLPPTVTPTSSARRRVFRNRAPKCSRSRHKTG